MTPTIRERHSEDSAAHLLPTGARTWLALVLAWQLVGLAGSLALALPWGDLHPFVKWLTVGLTFTNLVGLLSCAVAYAYRKWLHRLRVPLRIATVALGLALSASVSIPVTFAVGRRVCEADAWVANRYHLLMVAVDSGLLAMIALTCALVLVHQRLSSDLARRVRDNAHLERLQVETQLSLLQSKVNPHFLFNTLSTMLELVRSDPGKVERIILNLSEVYRKVLTWPDSARVRLEDEAALVRQYLEIEKIRMGPRIEFSIDVAENVRSVAVPPMILEILVENAVRHGVAPRREGGAIRVAASGGDGQVLLEVTDNGVGLGERPTDTGFGLFSVRQRLQLLYGDAAGLDVTARPEGGTRAAISLPYAH
jgi:two-component system, LytTR family, sensor kinase